MFFSNIATGMHFGVVSYLAFQYFFNIPHILQVHSQAASKAART